MADKSAAYSKLTVNQLKEELSKRELDISGKKAELVARLVESDGGQEEPMEDAEAGNGDDPLMEQIDEALEGTSGGKEEYQPEEATEEGEGEAEGEEAAAKEEGDEQDDENGGEHQEYEEEELQYEGYGEEAKKEGEEAAEGEEPEKKEGEEETKEYEDLESDPNFMLIKWVDNKNIRIPVKDQIKNEVMADTYRRTVVIYPVTREELSNQTLLNLFERSLHFHVDFRAPKSMDAKTEEGFVELEFSSYEEAREVMAQVEPLHEGCLTRHLADSPETVQEVTEWKRDNRCNEHSVLSRLLFVGNLPPELEESQLNEMFPDGKRAILARNEEREQCGYGYVEYETEEALDAALLEHKDKEIEGNKLIIIKCVKEKPEGMLSDKQRENLVKKIRAVRNALKFRGNMMSYEDQHYQKTVQSRLLAKLRADTNVRREHGLLPPERMKMLEERDAKFKAEGRTDKDGKPRGRGRGGPGFSPRGFRGGRGGFPGRGAPWGGPGPRGGWGGGGGPRGRGRGNMAMAMDLLQNISHALGGRGRARGGAQGSGYGRDQGWGGGYQQQQQQQQGQWSNKRKAGNDGYGGDWKRRPDGGWRGGGGGYGGGRGGPRQGWY